MATQEDNVGVISMQDFLHFLKLSINVNENLEKSSKVASSSNNFSFDNLSKNELVNNLMRKYKSIAEGSTTPSKTTADAPKEEELNGKKRKRSGKVGKNVSLKSKVESSESLFPNLNPSLTEKLDEVLSQGILDSFLPFICQQQSFLHNKLNPPVQPPTTPVPAPPVQIQQTLQTNFTPSTNPLVKTKQMITNQKSIASSSMEKKIGGSNASSFDHGNGIIFSQKSFNSRKKSPLVIDQTKIHEPELTIHVCDEVKGVSRDFTCPQKLLVSKMGYFADITNGQKLEDMDISVHCDLDIFDWLIKWVKKEMLASEEHWPKLNASNVIPILVSASFLQMEPLLLECLSYCHAHLSDVVKVSPNLGCLNDTIISRLAAMFTNLELEMVKDKKDRIQPRLFCKMIQSLCEVEAQALRGHYATLASLYRCVKCGKFVTQSVSSYVHCIPINMKLNRWGQIISTHVRDVNFSLSNYVSNLYKELRSWRKVYWRLWATCHFLYCSICECHFPATQLYWCNYHPEPPQYMGNASEGGKVGRYPCCGLQLAYRFESIISPNNGCQHREHCAVAENDRDRSILSLVNQVAENNSSMFEPPPTTPRTPPSSSNSPIDPWWNGMSILNSRSRQGILPLLHVEDVRFPNRKFRPPTFQPDSSSETESSDYTLQFRQTSSSTSSSSSDGEESECAPSRAQYKSTIHKRRIRTGCRSWSANLSARSNQDNQREFEEKAMKQIMSLVSKKTGISEHAKDLQTYQQGGLFVKLENEWKDSLKQKTVNNRVVRSK